VSKRFFDTNTWAKPWFRELSPAEKTAWFYMLTNCDLVGVWDADTKLAEFCIGAPVDWEHLNASANGNIEVLENGKWWLVDFCRYQYGVVKAESKSKIQEAIHSLLLRHGLWERYLETIHECSIEYPGTLQDKDKDKDKVKDKEEDKDKDKEVYAEGVAMKPVEYSALANQYGKEVIDLAIQKVSAQQIKTGKAYKNARGAMLQWGIRAALEDRKKSGVKAKVEAKVVPCDVCGAPTEREFGYQVCKVHGRREDLG
jgi:hypothetical protein